MQASRTRITARSRRQAMDWSLVLVSQGIETVIDPPSPEEDWGLLVNPEMYDRAVEAIRLYRNENRQWPWRKEVPRTQILFDWGSLPWALILVAFHAISARMNLHDPGLMDSSAVAGGQWWRLFTAVWLHADVGHLAANATLGFVLLGLAMGRFGTGVGLLLAYLAGAGGNVAAWLTTMTPHRSLGASGMVMGALGLLTVQSVQLWWRSAGGGRFIIGGLLGGVVLFVLLGLGPETDVVAHLGGFFAGIALGALAGIIQRPWQKPNVNLACGTIFVLLTVVPWWFALRR